jgi:hypothetical protein
LPAGAAAAVERIERVLAVVDDMPVLLSETLALQRLKPYVERRRCRALIDELLMLRQASRLREAAPTRRGGAARATDSLIAKLGRRARLADPEALRRIAWRQSVSSNTSSLRLPARRSDRRSGLQQA